MKVTNTSYQQPQPMRYDPQRKKVFEVVKYHGRVELYVYSCIPSYKLERESMEPYLDLTIREI